jgi:alanyl aminopeptidase
VTGRVAPVLAAVATALVASCRVGSTRVTAPVPTSSAALAAVDPTGPASREVPAPRDDGRLPPGAVPERYALSLHIDPVQPRFSGTVEIDVQVPEPTFFVVLHARDVTIARAFARVAGVDIDAVATMRPAHGGTTLEELVLAFPRVLPAGHAELHFAYDGPFAGDLAGLFRVEEGGRQYAYTNFEAADARRAFPCFDEPSFKTPFDVTITTPASLIALANAPEASRTPLSDGTVEHRFATSRPLPTYLVAFAVGDFDIVEWQKEPFPLRAVTTKGRSTSTGMALEAAS